MRKVHRVINATQRNSMLHLGDNPPELVSFVRLCWEEATGVPACPEVGVPQGRGKRRGVNLPVAKSFFPGASRPGGAWGVPEVAPG
jgi:hypothetical protein